MSMDLNVINLEEISEKAILMGMNDDRGSIDIKYSMEELGELARAAGAEVMATVVQNKKKIDVTYYIGKGKAEELRELCKFYGANVVIFNDELSGSQIRNLEALIEAKVIDRTCLILDIFAKRASSKISKLQVELAQLKYTLPRLTGLGNALSRTGGGIGTRGPGEQKLEIDRRRVRERVTDIRNELKEAERNRDVQRQQRVKSQIPVVAIVGYTNAGKSTLMNKLLEVSLASDDKMVFVKDMLFATLDTYSRKISLDEMKDFVLVDTVGFVSKLPHSLVEAFKATLEEVIEADMLLHVVDVTNSDFNSQISITNEVLKEIGVGDKKTIYCLNKCDLMEKEALDLINIEDGLKISAKQGIGMEELLEKISSIIFSGYHKVNLLIPYEKGAVLSDIMDNCGVCSTAYEEGGTLINCELDEIFYGRYKEYVVGE